MVHLRLKSLLLLADFRNTSIRRFANFTRRNVATEHKAIAHTCTLTRKHYGKIMNFLLEESRGKMFVFNIELIIIRNIARIFVPQVLLSS